MKTADLDVVYILKPEDNNEELRYSLRSLAKNMPHANLYFAGYMPTWVQGATKVRTEGIGKSKYTIAGGNIRAACADERISEHFILMNDDFFIMQPTTELFAAHKGPLDKVIEIYQNMDIKDQYKSYLRGMIRTKDMLQRLNHDELYSYELHQPQVFNREARLIATEIAKLLNPMGMSIHSNTFYGNLYRIGGRAMKDCKIFRNHTVPDPAAQFLSTTDGSWKKGKVGEHIRAAFPEKCRYEA